MIHSMPSFRECNVSVLQHTTYDHSGTRLSTESVNIYQQFNLAVEVLTEIAYSVQHFLFPHSWLEILT